MQRRNTRKLSFFILFSALILSNTTTATADSTVTVYNNQPKQVIDGFGASDAWLAGLIRWSLNPTQQKQVLDLLFSRTSGIGLSLLRHRIPVEIEPAKGQWDWTKDDDSIWLTGEALNRGLTTVWTTPWTPPAWMKTNNDVNNGGSLDPSHYQDYADYLSQYVRQYKSRYGINIAAVSLQNEPDLSTWYESCVWTGRQFHDFIRTSLLPTFQKDGVTAKVMMPELSGWSDSMATETLSDPVTSRFVPIIASHAYWGTMTPFTSARNQGKAVWETEVSNLGNNDPSLNDGLYWARQVHDAFTIGGISAWHYWWLVTSDTSGQALINLATERNPTVVLVNKRLWTIGNFSRFVRPGARMVTLSSTNPEPDIYTSAFVERVQNTYDNLSVVAINTGYQAKTLTIQFPQLLWPRIVPYRTSETENLSPLPKITPSGQAFSYVLPPRSITTFTGLGKSRPVTISNQ